LTAKKERGKAASFAFRVKIGEYGVEIRGTRSEVLETIENLPSLISNVHKAFEAVRPKKIATLTVKTEAPSGQKPSSEKYPRISASETSDEAVLKLLETDWGKWRPRTLDELKDALKANGLDCPARTLAAVLLSLVKEERIRRWNTDAGYVYILAEKEALDTRGET
jgi:hypothetical protein